jgi:hypothetical protein
MAMTGVTGLDNTGTEGDEAIGGLVGGRLCLLDMLYALGGVDSSQEVDEVRTSRFGGAGEAVQV